MDIKHVMKNHAYQNVPLTFDEAYALGVLALEGCGGNQLAMVQSIAALSALHNQATYSWQRGAANGNHAEHQLPANAAEQIAGVCAAVFQEDIARSSNGPLNPNVAFAMDNCGMGGDLVVTANISTLAALIAAAGGIPMCKHGSPANADRGHHGSSDFIAMLGINTFAPKSSVESCVEDLCFGYTEALDTDYKRIHMQTHKVAMLPHMNDIIGPITNPLATRLMTRRVLGVNHLVSPRVVAEAYKVLNEHGITHLVHGLFIRGFISSDRYAGVDELSICAGGTQVAELRNGEIHEYHLAADDFGLTPAPPDSISPPPGMSKGDFSLGILRGEITGYPLQMALANAALLYLLGEHSSDLRECYGIAADVQRSGKALAKAQAVRERMPK